MGTSGEAIPFSLRVSSTCGNQGINWSDEKLGYFSAGHCVYGIADSVLVPLDQPLDTASEKRYRKLFLSGMDLTKDFFFSYTYNICYTVQHNMTHEEPQDPFESMFVWNEFLSR